MKKDRKNYLGDRDEIRKMLFDYSTIGMTVAFSVVIGVGIGYLLDQKVFKGKTEPWFTLIFLGFGIIAAFKNLYQLAKRREWHDDQSSKKK
jgi:F0F1-type ATP synthase assembly protein I